MFSRLRNFFFAKTAVEVSRDNPHLQAAVKKAAVVYRDIPLRDFITEQRRAELSRVLYLEIFGVCNSLDPILTCRDRLAAAMLKYASYQVLVIPPAPEDDPSGLRGLSGISGELKSRLVEVVRRSESLRAEVYEETDERTFDALWECVQRLYWESFWFLETFNETRLELKDAESDSDWYKAYKHAACAHREHLYRWELEIPPALAEPGAGQVSTAYSLFTDIVVSGEEDPLGEWCNFHKDSNIPAPSANF